MAGLLMLTCATVRTARGFATIVRMDTGPCQFAGPVGAPKAVQYLYLRGAGWLPLCCSSDGWRFLRLPYADVQP